MVSFLRKLLSEIQQLNLFFWWILIAALINHSHSIMRIFHCFYRYIKAFWQNIKGSPNPTILIKNRSPAEVWAKVENQKVPFPYTGARTAAKLLIWCMMNDVLFPSLKFFGGLIHTAAQSPWEQMTHGCQTRSRFLGDHKRSGPPLWSSLSISSPFAQPWLRRRSSVRVPLCTQSYSTKQTALCNR